MTKPILFTDFDDTITASRKAFCEVYNELFKNHPNFVPAEGSKVKEWNFIDTCPLLKPEAVGDIFKSHSFFRRLDFINSDTYEVLERLSEKYRIVIASLGSYGNISLKSKWIAEYLPFIKQSLLFVNESDFSMNKELFNMSGKGNIFIDDVSSNLKSVDCEHKIIIGKVRKWNEDWTGHRCLNWTEIEQLINTFK